MTILDELLTSTGDVEDVPPPALASGRDVVMTAAADARVHVRRVSVARKIALTAVGAAAVAAIGIPLATAGHQTARVDAGRQPTGSQSAGPSSVGQDGRVSVQVPGYVVVLPAEYRRAPAGSTNCNAGLTPTTGARVLPPGSANGCPLDIESVTTRLPSNARPSKHIGTRFTASGPSTSTTITFYEVAAQPHVTLYFPVRLADGRTVYVTIGAHGVVGGDTDVGQAITVDQASQLANGLTVAATKPCPDPRDC
jgi:hypothetical protein